MQDLGRYKECREFSEKALKLAPTMYQVRRCRAASSVTPQSHLQMASVLYKEDRLREAVPYYESAIILNLGDPQGMLSLGNTLGDIYR